MRVLVTGSADGLGHAAAGALLASGHDVVVHVRNRHRLDAVSALVERGAGVVIGDLADLDQTRDVAEQANRLGRMDAVIHNAGVYTGPAIMPVNVVAPYVLTMLMHRPDRLAIDPNDNNILYFGSRTAGLWISKDAALTWSLGVA